MGIILVRLAVEDSNFQPSAIKSLRKRDEMSQTLIPNGAGGEIVLTEKLSDDLATLYCSEKYSDVTFLVEDENKRIERIPCKVASDFV